ncbi:MAG: ion transporter [Candidatus Marinimicrobia bacterium]|nr:ion transporter [Candidatus Neomarinimicrobiota bacterium]
MKYNIKVIFRSNLFYVFITFFCLITLASILVYLIERGDNSSEYRNLWDSIWWALVTVFTVGYGDIKPITTGGRIVAILIMFTGISLLSLITATISSIFVARRIREDQGLGKIKLENHIVICGWYDKADEVLDMIFKLKTEEKTPVVILNQLQPHEISGIISRFPGREIKFVHGDITKIPSLEMTNIKRAKLVIILPNLISSDPQDADEKTILTTLNIKSTWPRVRVFACILDAENAPHVRRAKADQVFVKDQFSSFIIASQVYNPSMLEVLNNLLTFDSKNRIEIISIPSRFVGKPYKELFSYLVDKEAILPLGLITQKESISISEFLSADTSFLDAFIEKKLKQAGKKLEEEKREAVHLNPNGDYIVKKNEQVIILK